MRNLLYAAAAIAAMALGGQAQAAPTCSTTDNLPGGAGNVTAAQLRTAGFCVLAQDKLIGDFTLGNLPSDTNLNLTLNAVGGEDHHGLAFNSFSFANGTTYTLGFEVEVVNSPLTIVSLDAGLDLTTGSASLTKTTVPGGTGSINFTTVASPPSETGSNLITYSPGVTDITVSETVTDNGVLNSFSDTVVESEILVPEPASLALLGVGLLGVGFVARRKRSV